MVTLLIFILATIGLTNIIMHGKVLDDDHLGWRKKLRNKLGNKYGDMLDCYECTGFWCGGITGFVLLVFNVLFNLPSVYAAHGFWLGTLLLVLFGLISPLLIVIAALSGAAIMHAYVNIMNLIESKTDFIVGGNDDQQSDR